MTSAIPVQRSTNWANKPTGSWAMCWVQINHPSKEWWFYIYEIHMFALRWRDDIKRSSQLRTLLKPLCGLNRVSQTGHKSHWLEMLTAHCSLLTAHCRGTPRQYIGTFTVFDLREWSSGLWYYPLRERYCNLLLNQKCQWSWTSHQCWLANNVWVVL